MSKNLNYFLKIAISLFILLFFLSCKSIDNTSSSSFLTENDLLFRDSSKFNIYAKDYYISGLNQLIQNRYSDAILEFQDALKYDSSAGIFYSMSKCYYILGKNENATHYLEKALELDPNHSLSLEFLSEIYYHQNEIDKAIKILESLPEIDKSPNNKLKLAFFYETKDYKKSIEMYNKLITPSNENLILERIAILYSNHNDTLNEYNTLQKIDQIRNNDEIVIKRLIYLKMKLNKFDGLNEYIASKKNILSEQEYQNTLMFYSSYLISERAKISEKVIVDFIKTVDHKFYTDYEILLNTAYLSSFYLKDSVDKYIELALKSSSEIDKTLNFCFHIYENIKRYDKIQELEDRYSQLVNSNSELLITLIMLYIKKQDEGKSTDYLEKLINIEEKNSDIYSGIGSIFNLKGQNDKAIEYYRKSLELDSTNYLTANNLAYILLDYKDKLDEALELISKVIDNVQDNSSYWDTYGWVYHKKGNNKLALSYLLKSLELNPELSAEVFEHLGVVYMELNDNEKAIDYFKKSLEIEPERKVSKENLEILLKK